MNVRQNYKFEFWFPTEIRGYIISKQSQIFSMPLVGVKISSELGPWPMHDESFHVSPTTRLHKGVLVVCKDVGNYVQYLYIYISTYFA